MSHEGISFLRVLPVSGRDDVMRVDMPPLFLGVDYEIASFEGHRVLRVDKRIAASLLSSEIELSDGVGWYCCVDVSASCLQIGEFSCGIKISGVDDEVRRIVSCNIVEYILLLVVAGKQSFLVGGSRELHHNDIGIGSWLTGFDMPAVFLPLFFVPVLGITFYLADLNRRIVKSIIRLIYRLIISDHFFLLPALSLILCKLVSGLIKRLGFDSYCVGLGYLEPVFIHLFNFLDHQGVSWFAEGPFTFFVGSLWFQGVPIVFEVVSQFNMNESSSLGSRQLMAIHGGY